MFLNSLKSFIGLRELYSFAYAAGTPSENSDKILRESAKKYGYFRYS